MVRGAAEGPAIPLDAVDDAPHPDWDETYGAAPRVVVVGSAARDLDPADPRGWRLGGGASYGALSLGRLGIRTGVVLGVDPDAAAAEEIGLLREAGVEVVLVPLERSPVFDLGETPGGRVLRCEEPGRPIPVRALPAAWRDAAAWYLAPVAGELPDGWAAIPPGAVVALGWQGLLRELAAGSAVRRRPPAACAILRRADLVGASDEDFGGEADLRALLGLLRTGALLILTIGGRGGVAVVVRHDRPRMRRFPAIAAIPAGPFDPTGAGDVFLAGVLAARIAPALAGERPHLGAALRFAATLAAMHVERPGLAGVPTLAEVAGRLSWP